MLGPRLPLRRPPTPLCSARASSARLPSSCCHRGARARAPRGGGKLASVVTITNSIVLSRAPANKVIHYGASLGHRGLRGNQRAAGCPLAGQDTRQRRYLPGPARGAAATTLRPRPSLSGAGGSSSRPPISFISERQLTYTDWLPAAKCQLNCKCSAEAQRGPRWRAAPSRGRPVLPQWV